MSVPSTVHKTNYDTDPGAPAINTCRKYGNITIPTDNGNHVIATDKSNQSYTIYEKILSK
jgi:hypothetical protein